MASSISSIFIYCFVLLVLILCSSNKWGLALSEGDIQHHNIQLSSLLPSSICSSSSSSQVGKSNGRSLKVVHRHGPCSQLTSDKLNVPSVSQFLEKDQSRVNSIQSKFGISSDKSTLRTSGATLPAKSGNLLGTGNYFVVVGLGTPQKKLSLIFDTGSDLTWTQCQPCAGTCYKQQDPIFDPSGSSTYRNASCTSTQCGLLQSATGNPPRCESGSGVCVYGIRYGDQSISQGYFGSETLTLSSMDVFPNFSFGCGQYNEGLFGGTAGLLGLGRQELSIVSQTASKYEKYFSYCLPTSSSTGYLTFGKGPNSNALKFTPLSINSKGSSFYFIDMVAIKCGATLLPISQTVFKTGGMIIDSGTVITRLPPTAYSALSTEFKKQMAKYPSAPAFSILDTCFDLSNYTSVTIPVITFYFGGNIQVPISTGLGILYSGGGASQICLAFAGNGDDSDVGIFGNVQQQTMNIVYDVAGGNLGFGLKGCS